MIHLRLIERIVGILLLIEAGILLLCSAVPLIYKEDDFFSFIISALIAACAGMLFVSIGGSNRKNDTLTRRDGYIVVSISWIIFSIFGAMPYYISGYIPNFTDAYFETMSGFTTTGATIINNIEIIPHGLLFWRSLTQWIGGLGIVFFTVAVLPVFGIGEVQLFAAEATGPQRGKLHPRISVSGRWILTVYLLITFCCTISLWLCGMDFFDSINHALCTAATGGFSTKNASLAFYNSVAIENVITIFMFLSGINYGLLFMIVFKGNFSKLKIDTEFRWYTSIILLFSLLVAIGLFTTKQYGLSGSVRHALFHVISIITTTGFTITDYTVWEPFIWMLLGFCMYFGGCGGSTSGGAKIIRISILVKAMRNEFNRILHPNAVLPIRISGKVIPTSNRQSVLTFIIFLVAIVFCGWFFYISIGIDTTDAYGTSLACISNLGLTIGDKGCNISWGTMPAIGKWFSTFLMLIGRLELFAVLVLFTPAFWKHR